MGVTNVLTAQTCDAPNSCIETPGFGTAPASATCSGNLDVSPIISETFDGGFGIFTADAPINDADGVNDLSVSTAGDTPSPGTGPETTPSCNGNMNVGEFIYLEGATAEAGETHCMTATVTLPAITADTTGPIIISFWYHMFGANIGTLEVFVDGNSEFSVSGQQQTANCQAWLRGEVDVTALAGASPTVQICMSEGNGAFSSFESDIAIDQFEVYACALDNVDPMITCRDTVIQLDATGMTNLNTEDLLVSATDNNEVADTTGSVLPLDCDDVALGTVTITDAVTITDGAGNTASCDVTVTVFDTISPTITCRDTLIFLDATGMIMLNTVEMVTAAADNCAMVDTTGFMFTFDCSAAPTPSVTFTDVATVTDASGNATSCTAMIEVRDTTPPTIVCRDTLLFLDATGIVSLQVEELIVSIDDNCMMIDTMLPDPNPFVFDCEDAPTPAVFFRDVVQVTDAGGNVTTCSSVIEVRDTTPPTIVCRDTLLFLDATGIVSLQVEDLIVSIDDNCMMIDTMLPDPNPFVFDCEDAPTPVRVFRDVVQVTDAGGNVSTCTSLIEVRDSTPPVLVCRDTILFLDDNGIVSMPIEALIVSIDDNCMMIDTMLPDPNPFVFDCEDAPTPVRVFRDVVQVTDAGGNVSMCTSLIEVRDSTPPVVVCMDTTLYVDAASAASLSYSDVMLTVDDNCMMNDTVFAADLTVSCADVGTPIVEPAAVTVTDAGGNMVACSVTVTVLDTIRPVVTCRDTTIYLSDNGFASVAPGELVELTDNCPLPAPVLNALVAFNCAAAGTTTPFEQIRTDANGNTSLPCTVNVTVLDTISPVAICTDTTIYLDAAGAVSIDTELLADATDNCSATATAEGVQDYGCGDVGTADIMVTATDASGNTDMCTAVITILDTISPVAICTDTTIYLDATGAVSLDTELLADATDNCDVTAVAEGVQDYDCGDVGTDDITVTATDASGNTDMCTAVVTVL
ncbi:MAG: hypothetical protein AAF828_00885, partial [Bacteroidota bacterium]